MTSQPEAASFTQIWEPVFHWAERRPGAVALAEGERELSYAGLKAAIEDAIGVLAGEGVKPGQRVLIVLENGIAAVVLLLAVARLSAWPVPLNARLSGRELAAVRDHATPVLTLYTVAVSPDAAHHAEADAARPHPRLQTLGVCVLPAATVPAAEPQATVPDERVAALIYTSGTTGAPKGVMLSHRNLMFIAARSSAMRRLSPADRVYGVLPVSHVFGLASVLLGTLYRGARLDLVVRFQPEAAAHALAEDGITVFQAVPAIYAHLMALAASRGAPLAAPCLRYMSSGGAPLDLTLKGKVEAMLGQPLHNGYGLTETSPTVSTTKIEEPVSDDSVGPLIAGVEAKVVAADGRALASGEVGELWVRGPLVMKGYYRDPTGTAAVLRPDGWLKTGDLGRFADNGHLYIVGRLKELIIRSGFNVYPPEVEAVIASHPDVALAAVIGRPVDGNEEVIAFVQPLPGRAIEVGALADYVAARLAPYKRPARYVLRDALPATATGKLLKQRLRALIEDLA